MFPHIVPYLINSFKTKELKMVLHKMNPDLERRAEKMGIKVELINCDFQWEQDVTSDASQF